MPGPISQCHAGTPDHAPYVPSWCYPNGAKQCPCGHHEGYHNDAGQCIHAQHFTKCGCTGIPENCVSTDAEMIASAKKGRTP